MSLCDCGKISFGFSFFFRRGRKWRLGRKFHWKVTNARKIEACSMCYACVYIAVRRLRGCRSTALKLEEKQNFLLLLNLISISRDKSRVFLPTVTSHFSQCCCCCHCPLHFRLIGIALPSRFLRAKFSCPFIPHFACTTYVHARLRNPWIVSQSVSQSLVSRQNFIVLFSAQYLYSMFTNG